MLVFVHGVPETAAIWDDLRAELASPSIAVSLPGFGCARPEGFGATMDEYADWLVASLERADGPVDLVGHDWGALLTYRVATTRPDLLRSWAADVAGGLHPEYVWHDVARVWQTPGDGEAFVETMLATAPADMAAYFVANGVPESRATTLASWADETMGACILDLYRSATPNVAAHWMTEWAPTKVPGLVLSPTEDPFGNASRSAEVASRLGARHEVLQGVGHWWPLQAPEVAAPLLRAFHDDVA